MFLRNWFWTGIRFPSSPPMLNYSNFNKFDFFIIKFIHDKIHGIFGDKDDKYKEIADNLFINGIMDEKEYTSIINKKERNYDDFER